MDEAGAELFWHGAIDPPGAEDINILNPPPSGNGFGDELVEGSANALTCGERLWTRVDGLLGTELRLLERE